MTLTSAEAAAIASAPVAPPKPPAPEPQPRYWCADCGWMPVPPPRPGKDGRCPDCRSEVGHRRPGYRP